MILREGDKIVYSTEYKDSVWEVMEMRYSWSVMGVLLVKVIVRNEKGDIWEKDLNTLKSIIKTYNAFILPKVKPLTRPYVKKHRITLLP